MGALSTSCAQNASSTWTGVRDPVADLRSARAEESVPLVQDPDEGGRPGASGHVGELLGKWADTTGHRF
jgi:hypothetical protein